MAAGAEQPKPKARDGAGKRKVAYPKDFDAKVKPLVVEWAEGKEFPSWWVSYTLESFRNKAEQNGWTYANWYAAAREFFRGEIRFGKGPADLKHLRAKLEPDDLERKRAEKARAESAMRAQARLALESGPTPAADPQALVRTAIAAQRAKSEETGS